MADHQRLQLNSLEAVMKGVMRGVTRDVLRGLAYHAVTGKVVGETLP